MVLERGEGAETQDPLDAQAGMGVLEGTIARSINSRHVGILSRVKVGWRRASNRVRVGAGAAAVIERQLNGFMGSWAGVGTPAGRQSAHTRH